MAPSSSDLCNLSLCEVSDLIGAGEVTSAEVLEASLARIDRLDPVHHAFVRLDRDSAMDRARSLDQARTNGEATGPLHGVPMAHKDMYYRQGRVSACGSRVTDGKPSSVTSDALENLDDAGAVDLGGLAMVEFAMGPHGYNAHLPRALNPWGLNRVPCGSSSGSGVAVSSRMVYASLGSDTGGSIRCPAAANGIVGCMPTSGLVSRRGSMAMSWSLDCVGPLTRTVRDAARVLTSLVDRTAPAAAPASQNFESGIEDSLKGLRIGVPKGYFDEQLDPAVEKVVSASLDVLRGAGATIVEVAIPDSVALASSLHPLVMKAEGAANHRNWKRTRADRYTDEVGKRLEAGFFIPATDYINALQYRAYALQDFLSNVLAKVDVLHTPVLPIPTPTLEQTAYRDGPAYLNMVVSLTRNTRPVNFLGLPALSVTCGKTPDGMPTSFQLVGRPYSEATLFRMGHRFQMETPHHRQIPSALVRDN